MLIGERKSVKTLGRKDSLRERFFFSLFFILFSSFSSCDMRKRFSEVDSRVKEKKPLSFNRRLRSVGHIVFITTLIACCERKKKNKIFFFLFQNWPKKEKMTTTGHQFEAKTEMKKSRGFNQILSFDLTRKYDFFLIYFFLPSFSFSLRCFQRERERKRKKRASEM